MRIVEKLGMVLSSVDEARHREDPTYLELAVRESMQCDDMYFVDLHNMCTSDGDLVDVLMDDVALSRDEIDDLSELLGRILAEIDTLGDKPVPLR